MSLRFEEQLQIAEHRDVTQLGLQCLCAISTVLQTKSLGHTDIDVTANHADKTQHVK